MARVELQLQLFELLDEGGANERKRLNIEVNAGNADDIDDPRFILVICGDPPRTGEERHGAGFYASLDLDAADALATFLWEAVTTLRNALTREDG